MGIAELDIVLESLPAGERKLFDRIFHVSVSTGRLNPPATMHHWIEQHFGSVAATSNQRVVKVTNLVTSEGALFNSLRAGRPIEAKEKLDVTAQIVQGALGDPLQDPHRDTPEDIFGRVEGKHCITGSNIAKYDGLHGMVIFRERNPLLFSEEQIIDYLDTAWRWAEKAHHSDPEAKYFTLIWNCLWRAGASLLHGHAQVMLARDMHYAKVEGLRQAALRYQAEYGSNYFADLYQVHLSLGCALEKEGIRVIAYLTPIKENEVLLLAPEFNLSLKERIYEALACFRDRLHVFSFNLFLATAPLSPAPESWDGFPVLVRLVDRGDLESRASDIGSMELYTSSVIGSDPFELARLLKSALSGQ